MPQASLGLSPRLCPGPDLSEVTWGRPFARVFPDHYTLAVEGRSKLHVVDKGKLIASRIVRCLERQNPHANKSHSILKFISLS
jgi:hypothetical protein